MFVFSLVCFLVFTCQPVNILLFPRNGINGAKYEPCGQSLFTVDTDNNK